VYAHYRYGFSQIGVPYRFAVRFERAYEFPISRLHDTIAGHAPKAHVASVVLLVAGYGVNVAVSCVFVVFAIIYESRTAENSAREHRFAHGPNTRSCGICSLIRGVVKPPVPQPKREIDRYHRRVDKI